MALVNDPGIRKALEELKARKVAPFVATSKPSVFARRILEHFGLAHLFRGIHGSEFDGALANGVRPIGVLLGYGTKEELADAGAAALCEAPSQIAAVLTLP